MNIYKVEITETLQKTVEVEADSEGQAIDKVSEMYRKEEIVLDAGCMIEAEITCLTTDLKDLKTYIITAHAKDDTKIEMKLNNEEAKLIEKVGEELFWNAEPFGGYIFIDLKKII